MSTLDGVVFETRGGEVYLCQSIWPKVVRVSPDTDDESDAVVDVHGDVVVFRPANGYAAYRKTGKRDFAGKDLCELEYGRFY